MVEECGAYQAAIMENGFGKILRELWEIGGYQVFGQGVDWGQFFEKPFLYCLG